MLFNHVPSSSVTGAFECIGTCFRNDLSQSTSRLKGSKRIIVRYTNTKECVQTIQNTSRLREGRHSAEHVAAKRKGGTLFQ